MDISKLWVIFQLNTCLYQTSAHRRHSNIQFTFEGKSPSFMEISENGDVQMPFKTSAALSVRGLGFHYSLRFNAISKISLISCIRFTRETIELSSSNSIIIMRDRRNPGVHSQAAYLVVDDLLSHTDSRDAPFKCFSCFSSKILRQQSHPWHHPKRRKFPRCLDLCEISLGR